METRDKRNAAPPPGGGARPGETQLRGQGAGPSKRPESAGATGRRPPLMAIESRDRLGRTAPPVPPAGAKRPGDAPSREPGAGTSKRPASASSMYRRIPVKVTACGIRERESWGSASAHAFCTFRPGIAPRGEFRRGFDPTTRHYGYEIRCGARKHGETSRSVGTRARPPLHKGPSRRPSHPPRRTPPGRRRRTWTGNPGGGARRSRRRRTGRATGGAPRSGRTSPRAPPASPPAPARSWRCGRRQSRLGCGRRWRPWPRSTRTSA